VRKHTLFLYMRLQQAPYKTVTSTTSTLAPSIPYLASHKHTHKHMLTHTAPLPPTSHSSTLPPSQPHLPYTPPSPRDAREQNETLAPLIHLHTLQDCLTHPHTHAPRDNAREMERRCSLHLNTVIVKSTTPALHLHRLYRLHRMYVYIHITKQVH
jgi:hypothetical protein